MGPGEAIAVPIVIGILFIGLPWLILHYVTQWKRSGGISREDEQLLDELHDTARRLDERLCTIERIMTLENPNWRAVCNDPTPPAIRQERTR